jgi:hypothetical protein
MVKYGKHTTYKNTQTGDDWWMVLKWHCFTSPRGRVFSSPKSPKTSRVAVFGAWSCGSWMGDPRSGESLVLSLYNSELTKLEQARGSSSMLQEGHLDGSHFLGENFHGWKTWFYIHVSVEWGSLGVLMGKYGHMTLVCLVGDVFLVRNGKSTTWGINGGNMLYCFVKQLRVRCHPTWIAGKSYIHIYDIYIYGIISWKPLFISDYLKSPSMFFGDYLTKVSRGRSPMGILMDTTLLECASQSVIG